MDHEKNSQQRSDPPVLPDVLPTETLKRALDEAHNRKLGLRRQREEVDRLLANTQQEIAILSKLIALRSGDLPADWDGIVARHAESAETGSRRGHAVLEAVVDILTESGRPVHVSELMRLLIEKTVPIPGSGNQANLISHLRRDGRIVRPTRGMYGLATWGLEEMPRPRKRRRRRRLSKQTETAKGRPA